MPLELVADFVGGVARGRELRNARELVACLLAMGVEPHVSLGAIRMGESTA